MTQEELATRAGISARAVSDLERRAQRLPRLTTVALLADALRLTPADRARLSIAAKSAAAINPEAQADEVFNQGDLAAANQIIDARCSARCGITSDPIVGLDQTKTYIVLLRRALPDISVRIDDEIVEGDTLVQRLTLAGTHSGRPFLGVPARGSPLAVGAVLVCRINSRGRIREGWIYADLLDVLRQITAISVSQPAPFISQGKS